MKHDKNFGITPELITAVKKEEGWVPRPYRCPAGYPTIGYGHRIPNMEMPDISETFGEYLLMGDLRIARKAALELSPNLENEPERRLAAIIDFIFNLGAGKYRASTLRNCVTVGDWNGASDQLKLWVYATDPQTKKKFKMAGLVRRRARAASWMYDPKLDEPCKDSGCSGCGDLGHQASRCLRDAS